MNDGWRQPAGLPRLLEQILDTRDCDPAIGELVLRGAVAWVFAPGDWPFAYNVNLELIDVGRRVIVRVVKAAAGQATRIVEGWSLIREGFGLVPGDVAVFWGPGLAGGAFCARFLDSDGNVRLNRVSRFFVSANPPSSPEFQGGQACRGELVAGAGAAAPAARALQGGDIITIREAMDLAVQCGAREGSDEHYMATKLFVYAENRAMFLTFTTNAGRLQWLRRCYEDWMN